MSATAPSQQASDSNSTLVQLCVKILSNCTDGMTTKELAAALDKEVAENPGFDGISSSILSSKLNAIFRRCHGDSATPTPSQLSELPLTRSQSAEVPRRLVYKYTPPNGEGAQTEVSSVVDDISSSGDELADLDEPLTPKEDDINRKEFTPPTKKRRISSNKVEPKPADNPGTPPDTFTTTIAERAERAQTKGQEAEAGDETPKSEAGPGGAQERLIAKPKKVSKWNTEKTMGFNLYYDALGLDALSAALNLKHVDQLSAKDTDSKAGPESNEDKAEDLDWADFSSPELLGLSELDGLVR